VEKYEYSIHTFVFSDTSKEMKAVSRVLTTLGKDGWELVAVVPKQDSLQPSSCLFYFKREKPK